MPISRAASRIPISVASPRDLLRPAGIDLGGAARGGCAAEQRQHRVLGRGRREVAVALEVELSERRPELDRPHPVLRQRAGLVGADDVGRAERLDRAQPLDEGAAARQHRHPDGERQRDRRQQPLGNVGDDQADREVERVLERQAGDEPADRQERQPGEDGDQGDQPRDAAHLALERAQLGLDPLREGCDPAELRLHSRPDDERRRFAADTGRAAEHEVSRLDQRPRRVAELGRAVDRLRLPGQRREIDVERTLEQPCIGGDAVALREQQHVAGDERARIDRRSLPVSEHQRLLRQKAAQRLDRALGLALLREREDGVEDDHRQDRDAEHGRTGDEGEAGREPEQKRQRMGELLRQLPRPADAAATNELVAAVGDEAALGLAAREPIGPRSQLAQQELDRFARIGDAARRVQQGSHPFKCPRPAASGHRGACSGALRLFRRRMQDRVPMRRRRDGRRLDPCGRTQ